MFSACSLEYHDSNLTDGTEFLFFPTCQTFTGRVILRLILLRHAKCMLKCKATGFIL